MVLLGEPAPNRIPPLAIEKRAARAIQPDERRLESPRFDVTVEILIGDVRQEQAAGLELVAIPQHE